jgi:hypothetical protein
VGISATIKSYLKAFVAENRSGIYRDLDATIVLSLQHQIMSLQECGNWVGFCYFDTLRRVTKIGAIMTIQSLKWFLLHELDVFPSKRKQDEFYIILPCIASQKTAKP